MQQVDFYLISNNVEHAKFKLTSRLCNKLQHLNHKTLVVAPDHLSAQQLDTIMWTYNDTSFVAHELLGNSDDWIQTQLSYCCVFISYLQALSTLKTFEDYQVIINLTQNILPLNQYGLAEDKQRIVEVVSSQTQDKSQARERYRRYQENQANISTHKIEL